MAEGGALVAGEGDQRGMMALEAWRGGAAAHVFCSGQACSLFLSGTWAFTLVLCVCVWTILSFIKFVTILLLAYLLLFWPQGMLDLSSQPGSKPAHTPHPTPSPYPAMEGEVLITGPPGKSLAL